MEEMNVIVEQQQQQRTIEQQGDSSGAHTTTTSSSSSTIGCNPVAQQQQQYQPALFPTNARQLGSNYSLPRLAAEILSQADFVPQCFYKAMNPRLYPNYEVSIWSDIGNRRTQEDRFVFCSQLIRRRNDTGFFGVFDGTVGDFASENVKLLVVPHLIGSPPWPRIVELLEAAEEQEMLRNCTAPPEQATGGVKRSEQDNCDRTTTDQSSTLGGSAAIDMTTTGGVNRAASPANVAKTTSASTTHSDANPNIPVDDGGPTSSSSMGQADGRNPQVESPSVPSSSSLPVLTEGQLDLELPPLISSAMDWMYLNSDTELVQLCAKHDKHYSSCTSVTVVIISGYCGIGHLGDSRVALGYQRMGMLYGEFLTMDHKPNMPSEQDRILRSGGTVEYLHNHNNKPFIRGGDFTMRKAKGEQPMQLQYSRAFGGKDLKMYGLSNEPDLRVFKLDMRHNVLILASDGIWDVQSAAKAVEIVLGAKRRGENPALTLITITLQEQRIKNQNADNLTTIVIFLEYGKALSWSSSSSSSAANTSSSGEIQTSSHSNEGCSNSSSNAYHYDGDSTSHPAQQQFSCNEFR